MRIAIATSEMVPFVKTGGLADVSGALPKALGRLGHDVTVFIPRYGSIPFPAGDFAGSVQVPVGAAPRSAGFYRRRVDTGVEVVFVEHPAFFDRPYPYGVGNDDYPDNRLRFAFFARACLEYFRSRGERPDVFHAHDWQAALVPVFLKCLYSDDPTLRRLPTVLTIHNLAYQGNFPADTVGVVGLPSHLALPGPLEYYGGVSYLKGGILFSELVTTVSPQYAREIQTAELGCGFDGILRSRGDELVGILNGVDYDEWDPRVDPYIARNYSPQDVAGKAACKADLLRAFSLPAEPELPLIGVVSRLVAQKGYDLVVDAASELVWRPVRMVVLGTGEPAVQDGFRALSTRAPNRFAVRLAYDGVLAHKIEAGADMFLMPSRFEPCGLTQMYSLRYGTVPIVRVTGGLKDTVEGWDGASRSGTGFRFETADVASLMGAIDRALAAWPDRQGWKQLMLNGMRRDFSWDRSARAYVALFERARGLA